MKKTKQKKVSKPASKTAPKTVKTVENKIMPLGRRVLIKPFTKEELMSKNSFGIILPDTGSKEKSEQGIVLAVGPGEYQDGDLVKMTVKVGDRVAFSKYGYDEINVGGEDLFLIKEESILAVLK